MSAGGLGIGDRVRLSMASAAGANRSSKRGNLSPTWPGPGERGSKVLEESLKHTVRVSVVLVVVLVVCVLGLGWRAFPLAIYYLYIY
jgi:hypothetical protein